MVIIDGVGFAMRELKIIIMVIIIIIIQGGGLVHIQIDVETINYDAPKFVIKNFCDCSACSPHDGAPICRNIDCQNRTNLDEYDNFNKYCENCINNII